MENNINTIKNDQYSYYAYLIKDGRFWRAYDYLAKLIAKVTGYKLMSSKSRNINLQCSIGIPYNRLERTLAKLTSEFGDEIKYSVYSDELYVIYMKGNIDVSDVEISDEDEDFKSLVNKVMDCDITRVTPVDALEILTSLQKKCKDTKNVGKTNKIRKQTNKN